MCIDFPAFLPVPGVVDLIISKFLPFHKYFLTAPPCPSGLCVSFPYYLHLFSHKLLHALGLCTGVIIAVTFEQVNRTPDAEAGTQSNNEGLENTNCRVKKCHIQ